MKIVTIVTGLVAMLSVAAAATPAAAHPYDRYAGGGRSFFASLFGPSIARGVVSYPTNQKPGTIIVSTAPNGQRFHILSPPTGQPEQQPEFGQPGGIEKSVLAALSVPAAASSASSETV